MQSCMIDSQLAALGTIHLLHLVWVQLHSGRFLPISRIYHTGKSYSIDKYWQILANIRILANLGKSPNILANTGRSQNYWQILANTGKSQSIGKYWQILEYWQMLSNSRILANMGKSQSIGIYWQNTQSIGIYWQILGYWQILANPAVWFIQLDTPSPAISMQPKGGGEVLDLEIHPINLAKLTFCSLEPHYWQTRAHIIA